MVKKYFRVISLVFLTVTVWSTTSPSMVVLASEFHKLNNSTSTYSETLTINKEIIHYEYSADFSSIRVENLTKREVNYVRVEGGVVYLDGEIVARVNYGLDLAPSSLVRASSSWVYAGANSHRITFAQGVGAAVVLAIIAGIVGGVPGGALAGMSALSAAASGGTVYTKTWTRQIGHQYYVKTEWSFTANTGDSYGPFTSMSAY